MTNKYGTVAELEKALADAIEERDSLKDRRMARYYRTQDKIYLLKSDEEEVLYKDVSRLRGALAHRKKRSKDQLAKAKMLEEKVRQRTAAKASPPPSASKVSEEGSDSDASPKPVPTTRPTGGTAARGESKEEADSEDSEDKSATSATPKSTTKEASDDSSTEEPAEEKEDGEADEEPTKRKRGRPKGSTKKKGPGRPRKSKSTY